MIEKEYDFESRKQENEDKSRPEVQRANEMYSIFRSVKIEVDDNPTKIEVSQDGNRVYYGGESFGMMEYDREGWIVPHGRIFSNRISDINPIFKGGNINSTPSKIQNSQNGDVMVGEFKNWNMFLFDKEFQELGRLSSKSGNNNKVPSTYAQLKLTSAKPQSCLWYSGSQNISVVDTSNYVNQEINNFWMMRGNSTDPLAAHLSSKGDIIGIAMYNGKQHSLHYYNHNVQNSVTAYDRSDVFPHCQAWNTLDGHPGGNVFFIGGNTQKDMSQSSAYLIALTLDENADVIRYREFPPSTGYKSFDVLKVYNDNQIFVSSPIAILIFLWNIDNFISIKQIDLEGPIHDMCLNMTNPFIRGPIIYALTKSGSCISYNFGNPNNGSKSVQVKPASRSNKVYEMGDYMSEASQTKDLIDYNPATAERLTPEQRLRLKKVPPQYGNLFKETFIKNLSIPNEKIGRVQVANGERMIYCGADALRQTELKGNEYTISGKQNSVRPFVEVFLIKRSGDLIVFDKGTGDLIKYDSLFNELKRLKGEKPVDSRIVLYFSTIYFGSEERYIWARGDNNLNIVNPQTFSTETASNFFAKEGQKSIPISAIGSRFSEKYIGLSANDSFQEQSVSFLDKSLGIIRKPAVGINPKVPFMISMVNSARDPGIFFAGGTTNMEVTKGSAILQAITFDASLMLLDEIELKTGNGQIRLMVSSLTRTADYDVLFAGVNQSVFVVEWTGTHFCILNYVEEIHSGLVTGIDSLNNNIYTCAYPESSLNRIDFKPS